MTFSLSRVALTTAVVAAATLHASTQSPANLGIIRVGELEYIKALFLNRTAPIIAGVQGIGDAILQYGPPLAADLKADAKFTAAAVVGAPPFDPLTADWSKIYTGFPQPPSPSLGIDNLGGFGDVKCLSNYALCAFAVCRQIPSKGVPMAECDCLPVRGGQNISADLPNGYSKEVPFSYVTSLAILDKDVRAESVKLCSSSGKCIDKGEGIITGTQFNVSPFCQEMQPSPTTKKPTLYGGVFVLISTFKPTAWTNQTVTGPNQGVPSDPISCGAVGGQFSYSETAACLNRPSFNNMPITCFCPIYTFPAPPPGSSITQAQNFFVAGIPPNVGTAGCNGTVGADGTRYLSNGGFLPFVTTQG